MTLLIIFSSCIEGRGLGRNFVRLATGVGTGANIRLDAWSSGIVSMELLTYES
jgi:hypothetical protein